MIKIYHNPRCRKSREGLAFLEDNNADFEEIRYLENPLSKAELADIIKTLGIAPIELVRKSESIWKENYKGKTMSDDQIVEAMVKFPKLIERPIVVHGNQAVVARPAEKIMEIL
ncbi:arsenate reductase (glutaredoxin) [Flagellimonas sp.]|uniref:arsenate reductase (glutaredoxin) n=1 Tax=Flagellimonas sp. TaxID=2058762 RepID=UPI003F49F84E